MWPRGASGRRARAGLVAGLLLPLATLAQTPVSFTVNLSGPRTAISPYIYGTNALLNPADGYTSLRLGGNRLTGYNWETNASNAGADYNNQNDNYLCSPSQANLSAADCLLPGRVVSAYWQRARAAGIPYTLVTLPMAGYVAADKDHRPGRFPVSVAPSDRWNAVAFRKGSAFTLTPDLSDGVVYDDELVNYLKTTHGAASAGGVRGYSLDNEPGLWPGTHPFLHPAPAGVVELWTHSRDLARAVKDVDPTAEIFGGVCYGFDEYETLSQALDWPAEKGSYSRYLDYFLDKLRLASQADNRRLLDVLDLHWYPQARGDHRIVDSSYNTPADQAARLQAPRTLWDSNYRETSYIAQYYFNRLPLLPRLFQSIQANYPGTRLGFSEYCYGGCGDISGGLAQADVLGIFGRDGVYSAQFWDLCTRGGSKAYISAAFQLYRNYDGQGHAFGDTSVPAATATTVDVAATSIYAAVEGGNAGRLHLVLLNKTALPVAATVALAGGPAYSPDARAWTFDQASAALTGAVAVGAVGAGQLRYTLPAYSATHLVLTAAPLPVELTDFTGRVTATANELAWRTATAHGTARFEVERSADGRVFALLAAVPADNGSAPRAYAWTDAAPLPGLSYYRLRLLDFDGSAGYSPVLALRRFAAAGLVLRLLPNPVGPAEVPQLLIDSPVAQTLHLIVRDALGRVLLRRTVAVPADRLLLPWPELPSVRPGLRVLSCAGATVRFVVE